MYRLNENAYAIEDELEELGFPSLADALSTENPGPEEYRFYRADIEKARRENTEDEMSDADYKKAVKLLDDWFSLKKDNPTLRGMQESAHSGGRISRQQIRHIIQKEKARLREGRVNYRGGQSLVSKRDELLALATYADRALTYFEEQVAQFESVMQDSGPDGLAGQVEDVAYRLQVLARNARNKAKGI
jgi:hypothetical protein